MWKRTPWHPFTFLRFPWGKPTFGSAVKKCERKRSQDLRNTHLRTTNHSFHSTLLSGSEYSHSLSPNSEISHLTLVVCHLKSASCEGLLALFSCWTFILLDVSFLLLLHQWLRRCWPSQSHISITLCFFCAVWEWWWEGLGWTESVETVCMWDRERMRIWS